MNLAGSSDCNIGRTFIYKIYFQTAVKKSSNNKKKYRNPIYLAKEYKEMLDSGKAKNQAELARIKGISRARVYTDSESIKTQIKAFLTILNNW